MCSSIACREPAKGWNYKNITEIFYYIKQTRRINNLIITVINSIGITSFIITNNNILQGLGEKL
jgi:hypothetical protein